MTEAMGTEGRQARRPRLSVTHLEDRGSLHGIVRMPRIIRKSSSTAVENNVVIPNFNQPESYKSKCLLDAIETPLSLLHCHTLYLESSRMFYLYFCIMRIF